MIISMKKIHMITQKKDIVPALESLRELGSVHVEHQELLKGYQLEERREEVGTLEGVIGILQVGEAVKSAQQKEASDWTEVVNTVLELSAESDRYRENIAKRKIRIRQWEPWGDFNPKEIEELSLRGIYIQLCVVPRNKKEDIR